MKATINYGNKGKYYNALGIMLSGKVTVVGFLLKSMTSLALSSWLEF